MPNSNRQQICPECKAVADTLGPPGVTVGEPGPEYVMPKPGFHPGGLVVKPPHVAHVAHEPRTLKYMCEDLLKNTGANELTIDYGHIYVKIIKDLQGSEKINEK